MESMNKKLELRETKSSYENENLGEGERRRTEDWGGGGEWSYLGGGGMGVKNQILYLARSIPSEEYSLRNSKIQRYRVIIPCILKQLCWLPDPQTVPSQTGWDPDAQ